jgi:hypothetical protein
MPPSPAPSKDSLIPKVHSYQLPLPGASRVPVLPTRTSLSLPTPIPMGQSSPFCNEHLSSERPQAAQTRWQVLDQADMSPCVTPELTESMPSPPNPCGPTSQSACPALYLLWRAGYRDAWLWPCSWLWAPLALGSLNPLVLGLVQAVVGHPAQSWEGRAKAWSPLCGSEWSSGQALPWVSPAPQLTEQGPRMAAHTQATRCLGWK